MPKSFEIVDKLNREFKDDLNELSQDLGSVMHDKGKKIADRAGSKLRDDLMLGYTWLSSGGDSHIRNGNSMCFLGYTYKGTPVIDLFILGGNIDEIKEYQPGKNYSKFPKVYYKSKLNEYNPYHDYQELYNVIRKCLVQTLKKYKVRKKIYEAKLITMNAEKKKQKEIRDNRQSNFYKEFLEL